MVVKDLRVLLFGKKSDRRFDKARSYLKNHFELVEAFIGTRHERFPSVDTSKPIDIVISYLSPWIIPAGLLKTARTFAINFHPGPPNYPGIGCTNFAMYNGETKYGVTCHHIAAKVDTGEIIAVKRFPLRKNDSVFSLTQRCYEHIERLFVEVMNCYLTSDSLPRSSEEWIREPYRRSELEALCRVEIDMPKDEVDRRIRATTYPNMPGAYVELFGYRFEYSTK